MSKRKNRSKSPNLPQETLERARQQAEQMTDDADVQETAPAAPVPAAPTPQPEARREPPKVRQVTAPSPRRRGEVQQVQYTARKKSDMDTAAIGRILSHPTKVVTEVQLREKYGYVVKDLRSMGILAAGLIVALIVLAQIL